VQVRHDLTVAKMTALQRAHKHQLQSSINNYEEKIAEMQRSLKLANSTRAAPPAEEQKKKKEQFCLIDSTAGLSTADVSTADVSTSDDASEKEKQSCLIGGSMMQGKQILGLLSELKERRSSHAAWQSELSMKAKELKDCELRLEAQTKHLKDCAQLEQKQLQQLEALRAENRSKSNLAQSVVDLTRERETLWKERDELWKERDLLWKERSVLSKELDKRNSLLEQKQKEGTSAPLLKEKEKEELKKEKEELEKEKEELKKEKEEEKEMNLKEMERKLSAAVATIRKLETAKTKSTRVEVVVDDAENEYCKIAEQSIAALRQSEEREKMLMEQIEAMVKVKMEQKSSIETYRKESSDGTSRLKLLSEEASRRLLEADGKLKSCEERTKCRLCTIFPIKIAFGGCGHCICEGCAFDGQKFRWNKSVCPLPRCMNSILSYHPVAL